MPLMKMAVLVAVGSTCLCYAGAANAFNVTCDHGTCDQPDVMLQLSSTGSSSMGLDSFIQAADPESESFIGNGFPRLPRLNDRAVACHLRVPVSDIDNIEQCSERCRQLEKKKDGGVGCLGYSYNKQQNLVGRSRCFLYPNLCRRAPNVGALRRGLEGVPFTRDTLMMASTTGGRSVVTWMLGRTVVTPMPGAVCTGEPEPVTALENCTLQTGEVVPECRPRAGLMFPFSDMLESVVKFGGFQAKLISNNVQSKKALANSADFDFESQTLTVSAMTWGQFIDHDIALVSEEGEHLPDIPELACSGECEEQCGRLHRLTATCDGETPTGRINTVRGIIDGHNIYGTSDKRQAELRDGHLLRSQLIQNKEWPPYGNGSNESEPTAGPPPCAVDVLHQTELDQTEIFICGDVRCNENTALLAMHTLWLRFHNHHARKKCPNCDQDDDDMKLKVFNEVKSFVVGVVQRIHFKEWLPAIVGDGFYTSQVQPYEPLKAGDIRTTNPADKQASDGFATIFYRFGHSLIPESFQMVDSQGLVVGSVSLPETAFRTQCMAENNCSEDHGSLEDHVRGLITQAADNVDVFFATHIRENLFNIGQDLAMRNTLRRRDHQLPGYGHFRRKAGLEVPESFDDAIFGSGEGSAHVREALREIFGTPADCEPLVCALFEKHVEGGNVGPQLARVLLRQFSAMRDADYLWYENTEVWNTSHIAGINGYTMRRVLEEALGNEVSDVRFTGKSVFLRG